MKTRDEITKLGDKGYTYGHTQIQTELLLDIRDLLIKIAKRLEEWKLKKKTQ